MNAAAIKARYDTSPQRPAFKFAGWADATPVEQFKAIRCLLYQSCEGVVPKGRLYGELNRVAGELAQRIIQDSPEYEKAPGAKRRRALCALPACRARRPVSTSLSMEKPA